MIIEFRRALIGIQRLVMKPQYILLLIRPILIYQNCWYNSSLANKVHNINYPYFFSAVKIKSSNPPQRPGTFKWKTIAIALIGGLLAMLAATGVFCFRSRFFCCF